MPRFPIVDAHLHLWDTDYLKYPWLEGNEKLNKPFLLDHYREATSSLSVEKMVFLQCDCLPSQGEDEVAWVTALAEKDNRIAGMVPFAPLEAEHVGEVLERYSANPLIKGVRRIIQAEPDPSFCLRPGFISGVRSLTRFGYSFDICINHRQLPQTITLVSKCPDVKFILDHIAKPDIRNHQIDPWKREVAELAKFENVSCKISGLVTEADKMNWTPADLKPFVDHVLHSFGMDRVIFGSDWPVVTLAATFGRWIETLDDLLSGLSAEEMRKLYYENSVRFYKL